jgi:hypothetical protein
MRTKKSKLIRVLAKDRTRRRPQAHRLVVRASIAAIVASVLTGHARVLDHRVVPAEELRRELLRLRRSDAVSQDPINVHVTPILSAGTRPSRVRHLVGTPHREA